MSDLLLILPSYNWFPSISEPGASQRTFSTSSSRAFVDRYYWYYYFGNEEAYQVTTPPPLQRRLDKRSILVAAKNRAWKSMTDVFGSKTATIEEGSVSTNVGRDGPEEETLKQKIAAPLTLLQHFKRSSSLKVASFGGNTNTHTSTTGSDRTNKSPTAKHVFNFLNPSIMAMKN